MKHKRKLPLRLVASKRQHDLIVGVVWYTASEWASTKANATDQEMFEETYEEWLQVAEEALKEFRTQGLKVQRSFITLENLLTWCIAKDKKNNAISRSEYVASLEYAAQNPDA